MIMFEVGMYTQVLVYSIAHSLSAQKQYKHKCKPGFIFLFHFFDKIFSMLEDVKIKNVRSICRTTNSVHAIFTVNICG